MIGSFFLCCCFSDSPGTNNEKRGLECNNIIMMMERGNKLFDNRATIDIERVIGIAVMDRYIFIVD